MYLHMRKITSGVICRYSHGIFSHSMPLKAGCHGMRRALNVPHQMWWTAPRPARTPAPAARPARPSPPAPPFRPGRTPHPARPAARPARPPRPAFKLHGLGNDCKWSLCWRRLQGIGRHEGSMQPR